MHPQSQPELKSPQPFPAQGQLPVAHATVSTPNASSFLEHWWVDVSRFLRRYSLVLSNAWYDGIYLTAWPRFATIAPLVAFACGLVEGITHWSFLFGDTVLGSARAVAFTELLPFMVFVAIAGALSAQLGLLLVLGYAVGDFIIAGPLLTAYGGYDSFSLVLSVFYVRAPQLLSYVLFSLLPVMPTLMTKNLLVGLHTLLRRIGSAAVALRGIVMVLLQGSLVYAWTLAAPLLIRVFWGWQDSAPPLSAAYYLQVQGGWVVAGAVAATVYRAWLMRAAYQQTETRARMLRLVTAFRRADAHPAFTRRIPVWLRLGLGAGLSTLLASGFIGTPFEGIAIFLFLWALLLGRNLFLPRLAFWTAWARLITRLPLLARLAVGVVVTYYLGSWLLTITQSLPNLSQTSSGTFQPLVISLVISLLLWTLLLPRYSRSVSTTPHPAAATKQPSQTLTR